MTGVQTCALPIWNRLPNLGGVDLSPLVVLLLVTAAQIALGAVQGYLLRSGIYF